VRERYLYETVGGQELELERQSNSEQRAHDADEPRKAGHGYILLEGATSLERVNMSRKHHSLQLTIFIIHLHLRIIEIWSLPTQQAFQHQKTYPERVQGLLDLDSSHHRKLLPRDTRLCFQPLHLGLQHRCDNVLLLFT